MWWLNPHIELYELARQWRPLCRRLKLTTGSVQLESEFRACCQSSRQIIKVQHLQIVSYHTVQSLGTDVAVCMHVLRLDAYQETTMIDVHWDSKSVTRGRNAWL